MRKLMPIKGNQQGMVSIVVTMIIMVVLTLIVTGFAQLARREQREALDRQLSTQAFYAAESGINDGIRLLDAGTSDKTTCATPGVASEISGTDVQYTCLLIKSNLDSQRYENVQTDSSTRAPISLATRESLGSVTIDWQKKDGPNTGQLSTDSQAPNGTLLPNVTAWGQSVGILRVDIIKADPPFSPDSLRANTFTAFLYPKSAGAGRGTFTTVAGDKGQIITANCSAPTNRKKCRVTIDGLTGVEYVIRMKSIYTVSDVEICANTCNSSSLIKGQSVIDSTGKANDVLKRIQVRRSTLDTDTNEVFAESGLDTVDDICKLMVVWDGGGDDYGCTATP